MAEYDWMTSSDFAQKLKQQIGESAASHGMSRMRSDVTTYLLKILKQNARTIVQKEMERTPASRRNQHTALDSAEFIGKYAAQMAARQGRNVLTVDDVRQMLRDNKGSFWPFG